MAWGTPKEAQGRSYVRSLKDGSNKRRVLPPIHSCEATGEWAVAHRTHVVRVPREDNPEKFDFYTYYCLEEGQWVNREFVVTKSCPECVSIGEHKTEYERVANKLKTELQSGKRTKDEVRKLLKPYVEWNMRHGKNFRWYVNVVNDDGQFFTEAWPNDVKKTFDTLRKKLKEDEGIHAIAADQGVGFDIVKTPGKETDTGFPKYRVEVLMEKRADGSKIEKRWPLPPESSPDAERGCHDLKDPNVIRLTRVQVEALVDSADAPEVLRGVFKQPERKPAPDVLDDVPAKKTAPVVEAKPEPKVEEKPKALDPDSPEAVMAKAQEMVRQAQAQIAARKAGAAAVVEAKQEPVSKPAPAVQVKAETKVETKADVDSVDGNIDQFMREFSLDE